MYRETHGSITKNFETCIVEATGSEARHIIELLQAESEGRLAIIPKQETTSNSVVVVQPEWKDAFLRTFLGGIN